MVRPISTIASRHRADWIPNILASMPIFGHQLLLAFILNISIIFDQETLITLSTQVLSRFGSTHVEVGIAVAMEKWS